MAFSAKKNGVQVVSEFVRRIFVASESGEGSNP